LGKWGINVPQSALSASTLFRTRGWLTLAQLIQYWADELVAPGEDRPGFQRELLRFLFENMINGRLDNAAPLRDDGERLGLRYITNDNRAAFVEGRLIGPSSDLHRIVVMKEAVLDFARRHQLPPPSLWTDFVDAPILATIVSRSVVKRPNDQHQ
jgi:hypothetical protein